MLDPVAELNPLDDFGQPVLTVEFAPFLLGRQYQLVGHRQRRLAAEAAFGLGGSVPDGGEGALNRVRGSDVLPVLGREIVEGQGNPLISNGVLSQNLRGHFQFLGGCDATDAHVRAVVVVCP